MPDTNIPNSFFLIIESCEHVNRMNLVHCHHLYINEISGFVSLLPGST